MIFVLRKIWILFVVAMVVTPCLVEGFDLVGREVFPESMDCISMLRKLLSKESYKLEEVWMSPVVHDSFFGWIKDGNQLLASPVAEQSSDSLAFSEISPKPNKNSNTCNNKASCDPGIGYYIFHVVGYLSIVTAIYHVHGLGRYERDMFFDIWSHFDDLKHNVKVTGSRIYRRSGGANR